MLTNKFLKSVLFLFTLTVLVSSVMNAQVDRSKRPLPAEAKAVNIAESKTFTLENGLKVVVVEDHKLPLISLSLSVDNDPVAEKENAGYIDITGKLLRTGTKNKSKVQIDKAIDFIGASFNVSASGFYASSLKKHSSELLSIVSEVITEPSFPQEEFENLKKQAISNLASSKDEPNAIADKLSKKIFYGENHPYADIESEQSISSINIDLCKEYYSKYYRPNISYLSIVGDVTLSEAKEMATKYFGKWKSAAVPSAVLPSPSAPLVNKVAMVDRPNSVQSVLIVGYPVKINLASPDVLQARVMNTILGGGVFRLFENLREKHGYTYGAYSTLDNDKYIGSFSASADVRNEVTDSSITQIIYELKRIRNEKVSTEELSKAINYLTGAFAIQLETPQTVANFATNIEKYGLAKDFYKTYLTRLSKVTPEEIQSAAKKYILPENLYILCVGKQSEVADKLKKFSIAGKVDYYDVDIKKIDPNAAVLPEGVDAKDIINKYIAAIGGKEKLDGVKDRTMEASMTMQGMDVTITTYQKAPNKFMVKTSFQGMEQKVYSDGTKGGSSSPMGNKEFSEKDLNDSKFQYGMNSLSNLDAFNAKLKLEGVKNISGKDAYKISITLPSGTVLTSYFDKESHLKVRDESEAESPQGTFTQVVDYNDYREVSGIMYPFLMKTSVAGMAFDVKVTKVEVNSGLADSLFGE